MKGALAFLILLALLPAFWVSVTVTERIDGLDPAATSTDRHGDIGAYVSRLADRTPPTQPPTTTTTAPRAKRATMRAASAAVYPSDALLYDLAMCETGGTMDQRATSRSGKYLSFFQWALSTWHGIGGTGDPRDHSYEQQAQLARSLILRSGWSQFPTCSRVIGAR